MSTNIITAISPGLHKFSKIVEEHVKLLKKGIQEGGAAAIPSVAAVLTEHFNKETVGAIVKCLDEVISHLQNQSGGAGAGAGGLVSKVGAALKSGIASGAFSKKQNIGDVVTTLQDAQPVAAASEPAAAAGAAAAVPPENAVDAKGANAIVQSLSANMGDDIQANIKTLMTCTMKKELQNMHSTFVEIAKTHLLLNQAKELRKLLAPVVEKDDDLNDANAAAQKDDIENANAAQKDDIENANATQKDDIENANATKEKKDIKNANAAQKDDIENANATTDEKKDIDNANATTDEKKDIEDANATMDEKKDLKDDAIATAPAAQNDNIKDAKPTADEKNANAAVGGSRKKNKKSKNNKRTASSRRVRR